MKTSHFLALLTAVAGFGLGWALKPGTAPDSANAESGSGSAPADTTPPPRPRPDTEALVAPAARDAAERLREAEEAGQTSEVEHQRILARMGGVFDKVQSKRDRAKLLRLAEALGLDEEQQHKVAALFAEHLKEFNPYNTGDLSNPDALLVQAANANDKFEKGLRELLNEDQLERLDAYRIRETENRVESQAQQKLASLSSSLDLSEGQRTALLDRFRDSARGQVDTEDPGWRLLDRSNQSMGGGAVSMNPYRDLFRDPSFVENPTEFRDRLQERQDEVVREESGLVEDILTPAQLEEYRATLEASMEVYDAVAPPTARDPRFRRNP